MAKSPSAMAVWLRPVASKASAESFTEKRMGRLLAVSRRKIGAAHEAIVKRIKYYAEFTQGLPNYEFLQQSKLLRRD
jgi:hypothetical protein